MDCNKCITVVQEVDSPGDCGGGVREFIGALNTLLNFAANLKFPEE